MCPLVIVRYAIPSLRAFTRLSAPPRRLPEVSDQVIWPVSSRNSLIWIKPSDL